VSVPVEAVAAVSKQQVGTLNTTCCRTIADSREWSDKLSKRKRVVAVTEFLILKDSHRASKLLHPIFEYRLHSRYG
jgi:hypothetical protein